RVVAGSGSCEIELSKELTSYAQQHSGKEQLAINAFAQAMEIIPKTLSENAGLDPVDIIAELKAEHDKGKKWSGIDVFTGHVFDAFKKGIVEPLPVKTQAVASASDVAMMILRIDDIIIASPGQESRQNQGYEE
ncbi:MAG: TCP-1/cpn60 chaperonin family protein, partial [Nanoarchaeota archaeon]